MNFGKPTIVFTNRKFSSNISNPIKNLFEDLIYENLIFNDKIKLVTHIEKIWADPNKWWFSSKILKLRKKFQLLCSKENNNFVDEILTIKNLYEKKSKNILHK